MNAMYLAARTVMVDPGNSVHSDIQTDRARDG